MVKLSELSLDSYEPCLDYASAIILTNVRSEMFLVTVPHVAEWVNPETLAIFQGRRGREKSITIEKLVNKKGSLEWKTNGYISALPLSPMPKHAEILSRAAIQESQIAINRLNEYLIYSPPALEKLYLVGNRDADSAPLVLEVKRAGEFKPGTVPKISCSSPPNPEKYVTWVIALDITGAVAQPGMSGGPVFLLQKDGILQLIGLLEGNDHEEGLAVFMPSGLILHGEGYR